MNRGIPGAIQPDYPAWSTHSLRTGKWQFFIGKPSISMGYEWDIPDIPSGNLTKSY